MSNKHKIKKPKKPPTWVRRRVREDKRCPDCASVVKLGYHADGSLEARTYHQPSCRQVPADNRINDELIEVCHPVHYQLKTKGNGKIEVSRA